ncbi:hypothetical protein BRYFOR_05583 [Marvinbryantia formatexigens DSM 14469]|uniref:Polymerase beta nucleotidyltransferase domain-containing protein n=1 Tax=Marvinbryantia formatexigens DSM 14469 TaxID=478749 RepID=C6LAE1_9FIRM|nr:nucleotidyltransferase domain-containing protein [Marvinbryantia formatexigens]EET62548.1 hypothetical protein BRYFOR_05583 [Marvinbryantia formatexigens DSM 14469]UWO24931.1 nucleotidyltransferase domain-containing protein [Marvinbryantia formatexigens DSM 14469]SDG24245.1 Nucleotidyltransferase domain-containing protein [Marvinbryantia formatexigens]
MEKLVLSQEVVSKVKNEIYPMVKEVLRDDLIECVLYGSCARGDFSDDSDIDIALLVKCSRVEAVKYNDALADVAVSMAMKYFAIINFVCIPYAEYMSKKSWYLYFKNISKEGIVIHE